MSEWRSTGTRCPLDEAPLDMNKCAPCVYYRGASLATRPPDEPQGWRICCNWPLHNNAITVALRTGRDPADVLRAELDYLRQSGFDVAGTAAHGDALCRALGYNNGEVFVEASRPAHGLASRRISGPDPLTGRTLACDLRPVPMATLGLTYEANFVANRYYLTDSHGRWNRPLEVAAQQFARHDAVLKVLLHPAWWAFASEPLLARDTTDVADGAPTVETPATGDVGPPE